MRNRSIQIGVIVLAAAGLAVGAGDLWAAKPTPEFKKSVEATWRKVPFSRMTGKSGKVQTWAVVLVDGLVTGAPVIRKEMVTAEENCSLMEHVGGGLRSMEPEKLKGKKLLEPVKRGTVMELWDTYFREIGVAFYLTDDGHLLHRETRGGPGGASEFETFCVVLQFSTPATNVGRLEASDATPMLTTIEAVIKPFSSETAAREFAKTVAPSPPLAAEKTP